MRLIAGETTSDVVRVFRLPALAKGDVLLFPQLGESTTPSPHRLRISPLTSILEVEPNDRRLADALAREIPAALNGVIENPNDVDIFRLRAEPGQMLNVRVFASEYGSPLDSVVELTDAQGELLTSNDDAELHDSRLRVVVPDDGEFFLRITDHLRRGGRDYVYRVEIEPPKKRLDLTIPQLSRHRQEGQVIAVPRGNRVASLVAIRRQGFDSAVTLDAEHLPPGLRFRTSPVEPGSHLARILWEADVDSPFTGSLVDLRGTARLEDHCVTGSLEHTVPLVTGPPRESVYRELHVDRLAVAITDKAPFQLDVAVPALPAVRDGQLELQVSVTREEGFDEPIEVRLLSPPTWIEEPEVLVIGLLPKS